MTSSSTRDGDVSRLHPAIRDSVIKIETQLNTEGFPFKVFEAFRTPQRQAYLYAQGRTRPGSKVTWAQPWSSIHQYGLAVDFVLFENGRWSWDDTGSKAAWWARMHEVAKENGMTPIYNSKGKLIEKPHVQLIGIRSSQLRAGEYPQGGDMVWAEHLSTLIETWDKGFVPPKPALVPERPPLQLDHEDDGDMAADFSFQNKLPPDATFEKFHKFIIAAEGGFVDHPADPGGATKYGITLQTLSDWRGTTVTAEDVMALERDEADAIFRTNYYTRCRCGELPERTAMVLYNTAVQSGPVRAVKLLQEAFNTLGLKLNGEPLKVDGIIGRNTVTAARKADATVLSSTYLDLFETYLRTLGNFHVFEKGWLNRIGRLRAFLTTLPEGVGLRPTDIMTVSIEPKTTDADVEKAVAILTNTPTGSQSVAPKAVEQILLRQKLAEAMRNDTGVANVLSALLAEQLGTDATETDTSKRKLTPVNAALGQGIGALLDGRKSVIGIVGLIMAAVLPELGVLNPTFVDQLEANPDLQTIAFTVLSIFTGWGFLGKIDKAIREVRVKGTL